MRVVLDAWAIIAAARGEPAAKAVREELRRGGVGACWVNLGEVLYIVGREYGEKHAWDVVQRARAELEPEAPDASLVLDAARLKIDQRLSYADAFAVATAERHRAPLLTGDPEILALERPRLELVDLRDAEASSR